MGKSIQYKALLKNSIGEILWQPGPDRSFRAWETDNVISVIEEWENAEAQKMSEEQEVVKTNEEQVPNTVLNSYAGDLGSDKNASTENRNRTHLKKENPSSSGVKDRKAQKKEVAMRKGTERRAKSDAELEYDGILVTVDEGPVLVPGLTLLVSSS